MRLIIFEIGHIFRAMKGEIDHITSKVETLEMNQETAHTVSRDRTNVERAVNRVRKSVNNKC